MNKDQQHRMIVLTDIEAEADDTQTLVRLLLYANCIDLKGLVATSSCWLRTRVCPDSIREVIDAYGKVQPNLNLHEPGFPEASDLLAVVKEGLPVYGMEGVGNGKDSSGSDLIIQELEKDDSRPLWIAVWGGVNTLAQALHKVNNTRDEADIARLLAKLRVYTISDQDDSAIWIRKNFPDVFYIVTPGDDYGAATWTGVNSVIEGIDNTTISNRWLAENIQQGHGPLGRCYHDVIYGMEGDTPSYLNLIPNGLSDPEHPEWGGWGGRYEYYQPEFREPEGSSKSGVPNVPEPGKIWTNAIDNHTPYVHNEYGRNVRRLDKSFKDNKASLWRWRDDFQNDFAARMDWCFMSFEEANHPPVPVLDHPSEITVKSGQGFGLDASGSYDPDGDSISYLWFHYPEAGSWKKEIPINGAENHYRIWITAPKVSKKETAHFILRVTDKGTPPISRYKRVIVTIE